MKKKNSNCIGEIIKKNQSTIHPVTLEIGTNYTKKNICPSNIYFDNKDNSHYFKETNDKDVFNREELKMIMALPYLNFDLNRMLFLYNVQTTNDIIKFVQKSIDENKSFTYINRILNIWCKVNYNLLKKNNKILVDIYDKILIKYFEKKTKIEILENFIKKWFQNIKENDFYFNLGEDLLINLGYFKK
jgi:hypothetical protein